MKNLTTKCTIPTNPNSYWLTIIEKKKQKIQILSDLRLPCYLRIVPQKIIWIFWVQNRKKKRLKKNILTIYIVNDASNVKTVSKYYILKAVLCFSTKLFKRRLNLKRYFQIRAISIKIHEVGQIWYFLMDTDLLFFFWIWESKLKILFEI